MITQQVEGSTARTEEEDEENFSSLMVSIIIIFTITIIMISIIIVIFIIVIMVILISGGGGAEISKPERVAGRQGGALQVTSIINIVTMLNIILNMIKKTHQNATVPQDFHPGIVGGDWTQSVGRRG